MKRIIALVNGIRGSGHRQFQLIILVKNLLPRLN